MKILTLENNSYSLNSLPDSVEEPVRFAVLDNSNPVDPDFFFNPLIFLESFNSPAIVLSINNREITIFTTMLNGIFLRCATDSYLLYR